MQAKTNDPTKILYVDDRDVHVEAAMQAGMQGYQFSNEGEFVSALDLMDLVSFEGRR